jgi:hypothetical protein
LDDKKTEFDAAKRTTALVEAWQKLFGEDKQDLFEKSIVDGWSTAGDELDALNVLYSAAVDEAWKSDNTMWMDWQYRSWA